MDDGLAGLEQLSEGQYVEAGVADAIEFEHLELGDGDLVARAVVAHSAATVTAMVFAHRQSEDCMTRRTLGGLLVADPLGWM